MFGYCPAVGRKEIVKFGEFRDNLHIEVTEEDKETFGERFGDEEHRVIDWPEGERADILEFDLIVG